MEETVQRGFPSGQPEIRCAELGGMWEYLRMGLDVRFLAGALMLATLAASGCSSSASGGDDVRDASIADGSHLSPDASTSHEASTAREAGGQEGGPSDAGLDTGPPAVRRIGRFDLSDPSQPTAEWSGSAMQARFSGTEIRALIGGANNYFAAVVDGTIGPVLTTDGGGLYPVASGLSAGDHEVLVFRRDEAFDQPSPLLGFDFGAGGALLPPPATPSRRIEVIGDSISAGYGDECTNASQHFSAPTENEYIAYGPIAARAVGADAHIIAWSGKGLYQNLDGTMTETMPILWQRTIPTDASSVWSPADWIPDAVVINLGTNDYGAPGPDPTTNFTAAYLSFVMTLRAAYPKAWILCAVGPLLGGTQFTEAEGAINSVISTRKAAGDRLLQLVEFPTQDCGSDGSECGCDYHPSAATHQMMATILHASLHNTLGW
jgi:Carbohydrate esterase 2 N-terminal/GDSL-like Lipase/Acylhydrolase family